jgi:ADP-heptose:LPS heptosyltransferase
MKKVLRRVLLLLVRLYGAAGARAAAQQARQPISNKLRILLVRPDHLGDLVLTTPVIHALRTATPEAHITMMVGPWSKEVVARHSELDQVLTCRFPGVRGPHEKSLRPLLLLQVAKQLRQGNYDFAINLLDRSWWSSALLYLARIPRRTGYATKFSTPFLTQAVPLPHVGHMTKSCLYLVSAGLQSLGYPSLQEPYTPERYPLHFTLTAEEQQWVTQLLNAKGIYPGTPIVVIHPGTSAAVKEWRSEAWANCVTILTQSSQDTTPIQFILTGAPAERPLLEEIASHTTAQTILVTDMTIGQLAALLERAQLVLGVDSGPLHLAVAQGTPTVRIYGPIDSRHFGPWGSRKQHVVIISTHRCPTCPAIPCGKLDFRPRELASHPCVRLVPEQQVLDAIAENFPTVVNNRLSSDSMSMGGGARSRQEV